MKKLAVVAMSGGVDSSVAACLLKKEGFEVVGITMCFSAVGGSAYGGNLPDSSGKNPSCCGLQGIEDAKRVAYKLDIKHYTLNMQKALKDCVIKEFCSEYLLGRTPNPCVLCNQYIKFDILLKKALSLGAKYIATGHYARVVKSPLDCARGKPVSGRLSPVYLLKKAKDKKKDQSYFLYRLGQEQLKHVLFPLSDFTKDEVRSLARDFDLPVAEKKASQEICFLPDNDYRGFLKRYVCRKFKPGPIKDKQGKILGTHKGIALYTIGQREGLGIALGEPVYINKIDLKSNTIIIGKKEDALASNFLVKRVHFTAEAVKKKIAAKVRIRYNHQEALAELTPLKDKMEVRFKVPQFAITPGQSAVFYRRDTVIGGGFIDEVTG